MMNDSLEEQLNRLAFPAPSPELRERVLASVRKELRQSETSRIDRWLGRAVTASMLVAVLTHGIAYRQAGRLGQFTQQSHSVREPAVVEQWLKARAEAIRTAQMEILQNSTHHAG